MWYWNVVEFGESSDFGSMSVSGPISPIVRPLKDVSGPTHRSSIYWTDSPIVHQPERQSITIRENFIFKNSLVMIKLGIL